MLCLSICNDLSLYRCIYICRLELVPIADVPDDIICSLPPPSQQSSPSCAPRLNESPVNPQPDSLFLSPVCIIPTGIHLILFVLLTCLCVVMVANADKAVSLR